MSKNITEERLRWIRPIYDKKVKLVDVAGVCPHSKRSLERWLSNYRDYGEKGLEPKSTRPKTNLNETPIRIKEMVIKKRKETKLCAQKLHWRLKKKGLTRKYRTKKVIYKYIKAARQPGEIIEIDVKYAPGRIENKRYYQYTAIDVASRWRYLRIFEEQSNYHSVVFLEDVINRFKHRIESVKTDNGFVFTNKYMGTYKREDLSPKRLHAFDACCAKHNITHYLIDPGKPAQNGTVERSHREDREKFYDKDRFKSIQGLQRKIRVWNTEYNNLEHCGLNGKTPLEFLSDYKLSKAMNCKLIKSAKPTKVLA